MAHMKLLLFMLALGVVYCQTGTYLLKGGSSNTDMTRKDDLKKTSKILCIPMNGTSVSLPTSGGTLATSVVTNRLTAATSPTHSGPPSSSKSSHAPRGFTPLAEHCMPTVVPFRSLPNETIEDLVSSILPGLIAAFPNHTMVVNVYQIGLASGLHPSITANSTSFPTANTSGPATSTAKPLSFTSFVGTLSNIVSIVTSCIQTWFQIRNLGELRRLFIPRLAPLDYLIHLRHLPVLAFIAQGRANPAVAVARPAPVARAR